MNKKYQVIVLGLGAMGSSTIYQLAKKGCLVLGLDQHSCPHSYGSTHGGTRITRQSIGEGEEYIQLVLRSYEIWREIEKESGKSLLSLYGGLIISSKETCTRTHVKNFFDITMQMAKKYQIAHEILHSVDIRKRFPQFKVQNNEVGYYEYNTGFLWIGFELF